MKWVSQFGAPVYSLDGQPYERWWPWATELEEAEAMRTVGAVVRKVPMPKTITW